MHVVSDEQETCVAGTELGRLGPKETVVEPDPPGVTKPVPVIVTFVPPACGPAVGLKAVTVGTACAAAGPTPTNQTPGSSRNNAAPIKPTWRERKIPPNR